MTAQLFSGQLRIGIMPFNIRLRRLDQLLSCCPAVARDLLGKAVAQAAKQLAGLAGRRAGKQLLHRRRPRFQGIDGHVAPRPHQRDEDFHQIGAVGNLARPGGAAGCDQLLDALARLDGASLFQRRIQLAQQHRVRRRLVDAAGRKVGEDQQPVFIEGALSQRASGLARALGQPAHAAAGVAYAAAHRSAQIMIDMAAHALQLLVCLRRSFLLRKPQQRRDVGLIEEGVALLLRQLLAHDIHGCHPQQLWLAVCKCAPLRLAQPEQRHRIQAVFVQGQAVSLGHLQRPRGRQAAVQQRRHQRGAKYGQPLLKVSLQAQHVAAAGKILVQLFVRILQRLGKFGGGDGLEQIAQAMQRHGLAGKFKLVIAAEDDRAHGGQQLLRLRQHGQAVHQRHADIRYDQIRLLLLAKAQRLQPVFGLTDHGKAVLLKMDNFHQSLADLAFIIHQQQLVHCFISFRFSCAAAGFLRLRHARSNHCYPYFT